MRKAQNRTAEEVKRTDIVKLVSQVIHVLILVVNYCTNYLCSYVAMFILIVCIRNGKRIFSEFACM